MKRLTILLMLCLSGYALCAVESKTSAKTELTFESFAFEMLTNDEHLLSLFSSLKDEVHNNAVDIEALSKELAVCRSLAVTASERERIPVLYLLVTIGCSAAVGAAVAALVQ